MPATQAQFGRRLREAAAELGICPTVRIVEVVRALSDPPPLLLTRRAPDVRYARPAIAWAEW
jgi:hypothetical protein